jgi:hypothetical protein
VKTLLILCALVATAFADAPVPKKKTPDKFARAAADAFTEALAADEKGDLRTALGLYEKALAISPHPSVAYNIGDVYRRMDDTKNAILHFEMYLAMLPNAPDRALVEKIVEKLEHEPGTILLQTAPKSDPEAVEWKEFYILVDGEIAARPGTEAKTEPGARGRDPAVALKVSGGKHAIDLVSSISYAHADCAVIAGKSEPCRVRAKPRVDGHLVVRASDNRIGVYATAKKDNDHGVSQDRIEVPPGRTRLAIRDRNFECQTVVLDVPGGANDVAYLWVGTHEWDGLEHCRTLDVKTKKLHFDP